MSCGAITKKGERKVTMTSVKEVELRQSKALDFSEEILVQLKILNRHMALITNTEYEEGDA
jgi:hypothetical protein